MELNGLIEESRISLLGCKTSRDVWMQELRRCPSGFGGHLSLVCPLVLFFSICLSPCREIWHAGRSRNISTQISNTNTCRKRTSFFATFSWKTSGYILNRLGLCTHHWMHYCSQSYGILLLIAFYVTENLQKWLPWIKQCAFTRREK